MRISSKSWRAPWLLLLALGMVCIATYPVLRSPRIEAVPPQRLPQETPAHDWLSQRERAMDTNAWSKEMLAQRCAATIESWWNLLRRRTNTLEIAGALPVGDLILGRWDTHRSLPWGVRLHGSAGPGNRIPSKDWKVWVEAWAKSGWQLQAVEFRHVRFDPDSHGAPRESTFEFTANLVHANGSERAALTGDLRVEWDPMLKPGQPARVAVLDASRLSVLTRSGPPAFEPRGTFELIPPEKLPAIDPLIVEDLDRDGRMELLLPAMNLLYRMDASGHYVSAPLLPTAPGLVLAGLLADVDADGLPDLVLVLFEGVVVFAGKPGGEFSLDRRVAWKAPEPLQNPMAFTAGDANGDGRVDLFLGQYRVPSLGQILRPHYYDANDGHPSYLLWNDGAGGFRDVTPGSGLEAKRGRRIYSASWVDLDEDGDLDLLVASDFAGLDAYRNDGHGQLTDATVEWFSERHGFGMAQAVADLDSDGRLDVLMIGMTSPTVDRLEHLNLWRTGSQEDRAMRSRMAFGNRLFWGEAGGGFAPAAPGILITRSGWAWGVGATDFDNDGFPDVYVANGYQSQKSVQDYEPEFWLHDIHVRDEVDDASATTYFIAKYQRTRGQGWSYGGNDRNRLFWNDGGREFVEMGHLLGVALEEDSRCVVSGDFDGDGRGDLAITTEEVWPRRQQTLRIYRNVSEGTGHWIGFRFTDAGSAGAAVGARVLLESGGRRQVRSVVGGDAFRSQQPRTLHFGLGSSDRVDWAEVYWPGGAKVRLRVPKVDCYVDVPRPR